MQTIETIDKAIDKYYTAIKKKYLQLFHKNPT